MPSSYTTNLGLEKPATGEQAGVWGITANNDYDYLDQGIDGSLQITLSASTYNLNTAQGAASQGRNKVIVWAGALTAQAKVNITPATAQKIYFMTHAASGGFPIVFSQGNGGDFTLQPGCSAIIYCDGGGTGAKVDGANYNPQFKNTLIQGTLTVQGAVSFQQPAAFTQPATFSGAVTLAGATTVTGSLTLNLPGTTGAPYDLYYRTASGQLAALPVGIPGQALTVGAGPALAWSTVGITVGGSISGSIPYGVYSANAAGTLGQDDWVRVNPGVGLGLGATPAHTLVVGPNYPPEFWLDSANPAGERRQIVFATNGLARWQLYTVIQAESGSAAGSNLNLVAYDDTGATALQVLSAWRSNGNVSIGIYGDQGAKLAVFGTNAAQPPVRVRGAASQSFLQVWEDSTGVVQASIDGTGHLFLRNASFLTTSAPSGRLDLYGTVANHPLGTIHIGPEPGAGADIRSTIAMEAASTQTPLAVPPNVIRFYHRSGNFIIQFYYNGQNFFAFLPLSSSSGPAQWYYTTTPL